MQKTPLITYHGDPAIKAKYIARFALHRAADEVIQGTGFENGRGCFVGCTLDNYDHSRFPVELGWPEWLAHLADSIFEGLPESESAQFGSDLLLAVPVGADISKLWIQLASDRHKRSLDNLAENNEPYAQQCRAAIHGVIDWLAVGVDDSAAAESAVESARSAARSAESAWSAWSAARSAESAAAELAAWSAAWAARSAARSAESAAESAARSAELAAWAAARSAESAARSAELAWQLERDNLLALLRAVVPPYAVVEVEECA